MAKLGSGEMTERAVNSALLPDRLPLNLPLLPLSL